MGIIKDKSKKFVLEIIIIRLLLDFCFSNYVSNAFLKSGYGNYYQEPHPNFIMYCLSWIILVISLRFGKKYYFGQFRSDTILFVLYLITYLPYTSMVGFNALPVAFIILSEVYWNFIAFLDNRFLNKEPNAIIKRYDTELFFSFILVGIAILSIIVFGRASNYRISFNILVAYDFREDAMAGYSVGSTSFSSYLLGLSRIVIPCGIVYSIRSQRYILTILFGISTLISYGYDGSKTIYFLSIISILIAIFYRKNIKEYFPLGIIILLLIGTVEYSFFSLGKLHDSYIYRLLVRRLFFVPTLINSAYFDYMGSHSPNLFSNLLRFFGYKDYYDISYIIGSQYFGASRMSANTGTIGEAFWEFGYLGALIMPLLMCLLLRFFDNSTVNVPEEITVLPCIVFAYYLNNSSFTAACITHGLIGFCLIMMLYGENQWKKIKIVIRKRIC